VSAFRNEFRHVVQHNGDVADAGEIKQAHHVVPLVERQHALIEALRARAPRPVSGRVLAEDLGVRSRTVERDIARLRGASVPIMVRHGRGGGYSIDAPHRLAPISLTPGEVGALLSGLVAIGPYSSATAVSVRNKLLAAWTTPRS
jgi:predicted DNA-binding transcriptional regulator YafY